MENHHTITVTAPLDTDRKAMARVVRRVWEDQIGDIDHSVSGNYEGSGVQIVYASNSGRAVPERFHITARIISRLCPLADVETEELWDDDGFGGERTVYRGGAAHRRFVVGWLEVPV